VIDQNTVVFLGCDTWFVAGLIGMVSLELQKLPGAMPSGNQLIRWVDRRWWRRSALASCRWTIRYLVG